MKRRNQSGFTLVELLVVITIIGILAALLMPAVNSARESARRAQCINNMRNIGQGVQSYIGAKDYFPGYRKAMTWGTNANGTPSNATTVLTWQVMLMPYLERNDVYTAIDSQSKGLLSSAIAPAMPYWDLSVCPSDSTITGHDAPWTSYVCNTGMIDNPTPFSSGVADTNANGIFHDWAKSDATSTVKFMSAYKPLTTTDIKDGLGTTLMLAENIDAYYYVDVDPTTRRLKIASSIPLAAVIGSVNSNQILATNWHNSTERGTGFVWWDTSKSNASPPYVAPNTTAAINGQAGKPASTVSDPNNWPSPSNYKDPLNYSARPAGSHPGGAVVVFADGKAQFLKDDLDYTVYCLLMTPNGAKAIDPNNSNAGHALNNSTTSPTYSTWQATNPIDEAALN